MNKNGWLLLTCLVVVLMVPTFFMNIAYASSYYVDGDLGNDSGHDGSTNNPWKTISHAVEQATASDTVYIRYSSAPYKESVHLGSFSEINLIGLPTNGNRPVIQSASTDEHTFTLVNFSGSIQQLDITGAANANGIHCIANGNGLNMATITGCQIFGNKFGIHVTTSSNTVTCSPFINDNTIYANSKCGVGIMGYATPSIDGNLIYVNGQGLNGEGGLCTRDYAAPVITNNLIRDNKNSGINIRDSAAPRIVNNTIVHHNVSFPPAAGVKVNGNTTVTSHVILNNILAYNYVGLLMQYGKPHYGNDFNDLWANDYNYKGFTSGGHDIQADPLFVGLIQNNFSLTVQSPCINTGTETHAPTHDINMDHRPQGDGFDIGADEYVPQGLHPSLIIVPNIYLLLH